MNSVTLHLRFHYIHKQTQGSNGDIISRGNWEWYHLTVCAMSRGWAAEFGCIVFGICFFQWQGALSCLCMGKVDCVSQSRIGYVAEPLMKMVASWQCPLQSMVRDIVKIYTCREEWTIKVMTAGREKSLLSCPLGMFTSVHLGHLPMSQCVASAC